ncbi:hypothetical protein DFH08DRAFT_1046603 [Mycena albidolilacea]|uniref:Uncharacterized protein n=1 Tax=Mycena albidolilacea TaxID=1033008 RepID=A0AAD6Z7L4_9AGAR|nr:hypothetical protein DFH08DRAFT_1046603 [Mycena albidolilacea]
MEFTGINVKFLSKLVMRHESGNAHRSSEGFAVGSSRSRSEVGKHKGASSQGYRCNPSPRGRVTLDRSLCSTKAMEQLYGCSARQEVWQRLPWKCHRTPHHRAPRMPKVDLHASKNMRKPPIIANHNGPPNPTAGREKIPGAASLRTPLLWCRRSLGHKHPKPRLRWEVHHMILHLGDVCIIPLGRCTLYSG